MTSLSYLSHGNAKSGGHNHERFLVSKIALSLNLSIDVLHKAGVFTGLLGHLKLWFWAFLQPKGKLIIAQDRLIIPVLLSTLFSRANVVSVVHHYRLGGKTIDLQALNLKIIFFWAKLFGLKRLKLVAVSPFWQQHLQAQTGPRTPVFLFPNFFDTKQYVNRKTNKISTRVYLGQVSGKNDTAGLLHLAAILSQNGYECVMTTLSNIDQKLENIHIYGNLPHQDYLDLLSSCNYAVALIKDDEGWNRCMHESALLGCKLLGTAKGGLGDLLQETNGAIVSGAAEAANCILNWQFTEVKMQVSPQFFKKYDHEHWHVWLQPVLNSLIQQKATA